jgi:ATP-binding protein involved in chromosome partitioning
MSAINTAVLEEAVAQYVDPYLQKNLVELGALKNLSVSDGNVSVSIELPYACSGLHGAIQQIVTTNLEDVSGVEQVEVIVSSKVLTHEVQNNLKSLSNVKNIIAVASGKGGVGKSTNAVNLALAMAQEGARVGILDADIYGPSVGMMLGVADGTRPDTVDDKAFLPIEAHGIQAMSMAFLVTEQTPVVWRGPMVSGALQQLLTQTNWDDLDYLFIDMPPGTGDIQLTLSQKVPVTGAIIVTTPQDVALMDCKKGIEMFRKVNIPVFGVIENMSVHICSNCGHHEHLFGEDGGKRIAEAYDTTVLGEMPLRQKIREHIDQGAPTVVAEPDSDVTLLYRDIARKVGAQLATRAKNSRNVFPEIIVSSD